MLCLSTLCPGIFAIDANRAIWALREMSERLMLRFRGDMTSLPFRVTLMT
jgi:hypothetical protein